MPAQAKARLVLAQKLAPEDFPIFSHDPNHPVGVFRVVAHQLGQGVHLPFQTVQPPQDALRDARLRLGGRQADHAPRFFSGGFFGHGTRSILSTPDRVNPSYFRPVLLRSVA